MSCQSPTGVLDGHEQSGLLREHSSGGDRLQTGGVRSRGLQGALRDHRDGSFHRRQGHRRCNRRKTVRPRGNLPNPRKNNPMPGLQTIKLDYSGSKPVKGKKCWLSIFTRSNCCNSKNMAIINFLET